MQNLPHEYAVSASSRSSDNVTLKSPGLQNLESAPPSEFGGPGDLWSPETLLVAAVADCFVLSFRAIARASKLEWNAISCDVDAVLDRVDGVTRFTEFAQRVVLEVPNGTDEGRATRLLEKAEHVCLITNSMTAESRLDAEVRIVD